jgi:hypothetical protein
MNWFDRLKKTIVNMAFPVLLGFLIIWLDRYLWIAPADKDKVFADSIKDIAIVVIGVSVVEIVWAILGGAPTEEKLTTLLADLQKTRADIHSDVSSMSALSSTGDRLGIVNFGISEDKLGYPTDEFKLNAERAMTGIDLCGATLNYIYKNDALGYALAAAANRGIPVRILLPSPSSDKKVAIFKDDFKDSIDVGVKDLTASVKKKSTTIKIRHLSAKAIPVCILRVDDTMVVTPYMFSFQTSECPRFRLRGPSELFQKYQIEFDELFAAAEDA